MSQDGPVLVTWLSKANDPWDRGDQARGLGPNLALLFDPASAYARKIHDVVLLYRHEEGDAGRAERRACQLTRREILDRDPWAHVEVERWPGHDPTDHREIFDFLRDLLPRLRQRYAGRELILHVSPGTPSMQTVMVLMAETGFVAPPFTAVRSHRPEDRRGPDAVLPVRLGLETFYKVFQETRSRPATGAVPELRLDPGRLRTRRMRELVEEARRLAQVNVPVLLRGERGTGKSTLARWIRSAGPFRKPELDRSWPAVACGQYTAELMRAELFGYRKGAFTGADEDRNGLLAVADRDTLFLDEVGDVTPELQRLLIKALEEGEFTPLGATRPVRSRFRLLSATNLDDERLRDRLHPDFLDRIGLLELRLPPLREVPAELPWMWDDVHALAARRAEVDPEAVRLPDAARSRVLQALSRHPLPGNLRALFAVAYRIVAARADVTRPLSVADAVDYGLAALDASGDPDGGLVVARRVARAFAAGAPLDDLLAGPAPLATHEVLRELKVYLATELRRAARETGKDVESLCDVSDRSLRQWVHSPAGSDPQASGR